MYAGVVINDPNLIQAASNEEAGKFQKENS